MKKLEWKYRLAPPAEPFIVLIAIGCVCIYAAHFILWPTGFDLLNLRWRWRA